MQCIVVGTCTQVPALVLQDFKPDLNEFSTINCSIELIVLYIMGIFSSKCVCFLNLFKFEPKK